jgi:hypothetical protein
VKKKLKNPGCPRCLEGVTKDYDKRKKCPHRRKTIFCGPSHTGVKAKVSFLEIFGLLTCSLIWKREKLNKHLTSVVIKNTKD